MKKEIPYDKGEQLRSEDELKGYIWNVVIMNRPKDLRCWKDDDKIKDFVDRMVDEYAVFLLFYGGCSKEKIAKEVGSKTYRFFVDLGWKKLGSKYKGKWVYTPIKKKKRARKRFRTGELNEKNIYK